MTTTKKMKISSSDSSPSTSLLPPPTSFTSLPSDIVLNILARISLNHRPTLSLVCKSFRSLLASPELYATRSLIGRTENCIYLCLDLNKNNPTPRWFTLVQTTPEQQRLLIPIPSFPSSDHYKSTVVSTGSEIYIIGGCTRRKKRKSSRSVFHLDCRSHQWSRLEDMRVGRQTPAAEVIDGKMYVIGGCASKQDKDWGEVYDPKTQTWEQLLPTTLDLTTRESVVRGGLVMGGQVYEMDGLKLYPAAKRICLVEMDEKVFCQLAESDRKLIWVDAKEGLRWGNVMGLGEFPDMPYDTSYLVAMANSGRGRIVTLWWKDWEIWCVEISFERRTSQELWGFVEWSTSVLEDRYGCDSDFFLHSALVTH